MFLTMERGPDNHEIWVAVVTQANCPKSVRYCCVIEYFGGVFVLSLCVFKCSLGVENFVKGLNLLTLLFLFNS